MAEHKISGWYCLGCERPRRIEDFGTPCPCGAYPIACDEEHRFSYAELAKLPGDVGAEQEDEPDRDSDEEENEVVQGEVHEPTVLSPSDDAALGEGT